MRKNAFPLFPFEEILNYTIWQIAESSSSPDGATTAEENLKVTEEQPKPSAGQEQGQTSSAASDKETASSVPSSQQRGG